MTVLLNPSTETCFVLTCLRRVVIRFQRSHPLPIPVEASGFSTRKTASFMGINTCVVCWV